MNVRMWQHAATQANMALLAARGIHVVGPGRRRDGVQRIRSGAAGRAAGDPGGDRGIARAVGSACRSARAGHQRADARADRPGALHRQPVQRTPGPCDRGVARRTGCARDPGQRPGVGARSCRRCRAARGKRAADAGCLPGGAAGGCRGVRRRRRRLARRDRGRGQDQEGAGDRRRRRWSWSPIPTSWRPSPRTGRGARGWSSASPPRPTT